MFSDKFQAVALMVTFGTLGVAALIGAFWNPWQLATAGMCAMMFLCGLSEYNKSKKQ